MSMPTITFPCESKNPKIQYFRADGRAKFGFLDFWNFGFLEFWIFGFPAIPKIQKSKIPKIQKSKIPKFQKSKNPKFQKSKLRATISSKILDFWIFGFCKNCARPSHKLDKDERLYTRTMLMTAYKDAPDAIKLDAHEAPRTPDPGHQEAG